MSGLKRDKIVVPVDFSSDSLAAVDVAIEMAASANHVYIIHVLPELNAAEPGVIWQSVDDESRKKHAQQGLHEAFAAAKYNGLNFQAEIGDPGHEIANYAQQIGADLIITPSHGRTGIKRVLLGSVAERVVRLAHCPVLVLRT
jgi:nucleotide-binding universal stress UspA family protein